MTDLRHPPPTRPARGAAGLVTLWLLRGWMAVLAAITVAQPVLAGAYLSGDYDSIQWHGILGSSLGGAVMLAGALTLVHTLVARPSWWPLGVMAGLFFATGVQIGMGYQRNLLIHVPLGVFVVAAILLVAGWTWTPGARGTR